MMKRIVIECRDVEPYEAVTHIAFRLTRYREYLAKCPKMLPDHGNCTIGNIKSRKRRKRTPGAADSFVVWREGGVSDG